MSLMITILNWYQKPKSNIHSNIHSNDNVVGSNKVTSNYAVLPYIKEIILKLRRLVQQADDSVKMYGDYHTI